MKDILSLWLFFEYSEIEQGCSLIASTRMNLAAILSMTDRPRIAQAILLQQELIFR